ncbi:uncharacterized protein LOC132790828 [Drosophila nasuta]|uniref:uncharacterized protein LOC132790828 n=1 Tax=Drosophila nasuta TaxID=42062 RepID=UPI00295E7D5D|nr:uncharacterized protein LOC132790828 [Drosophila nasuta]
MKFIALFLLCSLTVGLVLAFPDNHIAVADVSAGGMHVDAISDRGTGDAASTSQIARLRQSRHLLKKLFNPEPEVIVQPIIVQPQQPQPFFPAFNPYVGTGRGFGYGSFPYNRPVGY